MTDYPGFTVLILLVCTTSLNLEVNAAKGDLRAYQLHSALIRRLCGGEKIHDLIAKFNERRAVGILAQPRVGRNAGMGISGRSGGAAGLFLVPRAVQAGVSTLPDDLKYVELEDDTRNHREGLDTAADGDDQNYQKIGRQLLNY